MGLFDRKPAKVRGTFKFTDWYDPHPHATGSKRYMLTGVISAPGISPTPAETHSDWGSKWSSLSSGDTVPALVDPSDPTHFEILWKEYHPASQRDLARQAAAEDARGGSGVAAGLGGATVSFVVDPRMAAMMPGLAGFGQAGGAIGGVLRVAAVGAPSMPSGPDDVLVTGLLLDPMTMQLVQVTAGLPAALRPNPGAELVTVADPSSPGTVGIAWGQAADGSSAAPSPLSQGWDPGPAGMHAQAVAAWLAEQGLTPSDFGGMLEVLAPGMTQLLDAACSRYFTVIPGQTSTAVMQTGEPAQGVVTAARVLPIPPQVLPSPQACMALLTLQITPQRGAPYSVTIRQGFRSPERFTQLATVGTRLPLRRDPANPSVVALDNAALPAG